MIDLSAILRGRLNKFLDDPKEDRLGGILEGMNTEPVSVDPPKLGNPNTVSPPDPIEEISVYTPTATDDYLKLLGDMPQREDYAPGFWRRLGAGLVGAGVSFRDPRAGIGIAESIVSKPYTEALSDWETRREALEKGAGLEIQSDKARASERGAEARIEESRANREAKFQMAKDRLEFDREKSTSIRDIKLMELEVDNRNATTAEERAKIDARRVEIMAESEDNDRIYKENKIRLDEEDLAFKKERSDRPKGISVNDQMNADMLAVQSVLRVHPNWGRFVKDGVLQGDPKDPEYNKLLSAVKKAKALYLRNAHPVMPSTFEEVP